MLLPYTVLIHPGGVVLVPSGCPACAVICFCVEYVALVLYERTCLCVLCCVCVSYAVYIVLPVLFRPILFDCITIVIWARGEVGVLGSACLQEYCERLGRCIVFLAWKHM